MRWAAWTSCCSTVLMLTNRIAGRLAASTMASAWLRSFLFVFHQSGLICDPTSSSRFLAPNRREGTCLREYGEVPMSLLRNMNYNHSHLKPFLPLRW